MIRPVCFQLLNSLSHTKGWCHSWPVSRVFLGNTLSKMDRSMLKSRKMCQKTAATYTLLAPLHLKVRQVVVRFNQRRWLSVQNLIKAAKQTFLVRRILSIELKCAYISKMSFERGCQWQQHRFVPGTVPWKLRPFVPWKLRPFIPCLSKNLLKVELRHPLLFSY